MTVVKSRVLAIVTIIAIFGGIGLSSLLGLYQTTTTKEPVLIKSGEFAGMPDPADLRGSYTWADMAKVEAILCGTGASVQAIKDYCAARVLSFSELKVKIEELKP